MRSRRNSTDVEVQRLRRELAAEPADDSIRGALPKQGHVICTASWHVPSDQVEYE